MNFCIMLARIVRCFLRGSECKQDVQSTMDELKDELKRTS